MTDAPQTRGERNCNPCNIRQSGNIWFGMAPTQTDSDFVQFQTPEYGLRAACKILENYAARGLNTMQSIIDEWAPPVENDSTAYVEDACERTGFDPMQALDMTDPATLAKILAAIVWHENGAQPYDDTTIGAAITMAQAKETT